MGKSRFILKVLVIVFFQAFVGVSTLAAEAEYSSYDDIIKELKSAEVTSSLSEAQRPSMNSLKVYAGVGLTTASLSLDMPSPFKSNVHLRGYEGFIGIDLFSKYWSAEGALRSYANESYSGSQLSLKEFDLKVAYRNTSDKGVYFRLGGGVTARYLEFSRALRSDLKNSYTTPASLFSAGLGYNVNNSISAGLELNYKNALISDTVDKSSIDGGLRLTGSF